MTSITGLFGGTFDPVHNGHVSIAESFLESGLIDELWILLTPFPPHKLKEDHVDYKSRHQMLQKAFDGYKNTRILTIENELPKPSYTFRTIQHLKSEYPDMEFSFCMGEDSLAQFHTWKYHKKILEQAGLLVANRPGTGHSSVDGYILRSTTFVDHEPLNISSSEIRQKIRNGNTVKNLVPNEVADYIETNTLYK